MLDAAAMTTSCIVAFVLFVQLAGCRDTPSELSADAGSSSPTDGSAPDLPIVDGAPTASLPSIATLAPADSVEVGQQLLVIGSGFGYSTGATGLYFDDVRVDGFAPGSSDAQLVVTVPELADLPAQGRTATVNVYNDAGSASASITVVPEPFALSGFVDVETESAAAAEPGESVDIAISIDSRANQTATFAASAVVDTGWTAQVLDANEQLVSSAQLVPFQPMHGFVRVAVPADAAAGTPFEVTVRLVSGNTVFGSSGPVPHVVGQADAAIDDGILIEQPSANAPPLIDGDTVACTTGQVAIITLPTTFSTTDTYTVTAAPVGSSTGWQVRLGYPSGSAGTSSQGTLQGSVNVQALQLAVEPGAGASASGAIDLTIVKVGSSTGRARRIPLVLVQ